ncbi:MULTISPECIES: type IV pilus modification PilV family protein [Bhargavaea]|uniref:Prepilin-type N-terminal cleavage/methylation domain-containing protein n=1 Tax=Bhargavaea changchunensis TaxID=2134037 RepID=A0ABW2NBN3_9BACL|nr:type II secretion system protein [Bhargavaea sp. CC-171006]
MNRFMQFRDEKGLTLVEILATLVILGIVFIGIMTLFPQMTLFNERTEVKLDTMNVARQETSFIKSIPLELEWEKVDEMTETDNNLIAGQLETVLKNRPDIDESTLSVTPETGSKKISVKYTLNNGNTVVADVEAPAECEAPCDDSKDFNEVFDTFFLRKMKIEVYESASSTNPLSKNYGYLKVERKPEVGP